MKKLQILFVTLVAFTVTVHAQNSVPSYSAQALSVPATLTGGTTNLASIPVIGALKQQNVAITATISATAATTNIYTFQRSVDGIYWDTNGVNLVTLQAYTPGTTLVTTTTNFSTGGFGFYRLASIQVVGAGTVTNNSVKYGVKLIAP